MSKRIEPHFSFLWYLTVFGLMAVLYVPLEWAGVSWWVVFEHTLAVATLLWFCGIEWAASGVRAGYQGTMSAWTFVKIKQPWRRVAWSFVIIFLMWWRLPRFGYCNLIVTSGFGLWLPWHYYGVKGPMDYVVRAIGRITGLKGALDRWTNGGAR